MVLQKVFLSILLLTLSLQAYAAEEVEFKVRAVSLSKKPIKVWIADSDVKRSKGMMFKTKWPKDIQGMLFIFDGESRRSFWMKNTFLPLSLGYFDKNGVLLETANMDPPKSLAQVKVDRSISSKPAKYVLEVPKGWFKKEGVLAGAKLRLL